MDGNITREGITADLESMQRVGIHGALLMDIAAEIPPGRVAFLSEEWRALFEHAVQEAARLGLELSVNTRTGRCGWPSAPALPTKTRRLHSLPGRGRDCSRRPPQTRT